MTWNHPSKGGGVSTGCPPSKVPQLWAPNGPEPQSELPAATRPFRGPCRAEGAQLRGFGGHLGMRGSRRLFLLGERVLGHLLRAHRLTQHRGAAGAG